MTIYLRVRDLEKTSVIWQWREQIHPSHLPRLARAYAPAQVAGGRAKMKRKTSMLT